MRNKRKRLESGHGSTSQAYNCTKYSLLCYRASSQKPDDSPYEWELLSKWEKRLRLTRANTIHMIEASRQWLYLKKFNHRYYVAPREECAEAIEAYILLTRKNHPARKGIGKHGVVKSGQIDALNRLLYPGGVDLSA